MAENLAALLTNENQKCLHNYLKNLGFTNYKIEVRSATKTGDNLLGNVVRVKVFTDDLELHLIFKSALQEEGIRQRFNIPKLYERESYIYSKVFKIFEEFQHEKGFDIFKSYPKYYTHSLNLQNEYVIVEDMNAKNYKLHDRFKSMDYNHVMLVLQEYARLHALSFALRNQKPVLFEEITKKSDEFFLCSFTTETLAKINNKLKYVEDAFDMNSQKNAYNKFLILKRNFPYIAQNVMQSKEFGKYGVIRHGDSWNNNFLFQYLNSDKPNSPSNLAIIDWQLSHLGSPVLDMVHFLYTCTDKCFRDLHYNEVIAKYYDCLSGFLNDLGSEVAQLFPYSVYQDHLRKFSVFGLYIAVQILYITFSLQNVSSVEDFRGKLLQRILSDGTRLSTSANNNEDSLTTSADQAVTDAPPPTPEEEFQPVKKKQRKTKKKTATPPTPMDIDHHRDADDSQSDDAIPTVSPTQTHDGIPSQNPQPCDETRNPPSQTQDNPTPNPSPSQRPNTNESRPLFFGTNPNGQQPPPFSTPTKSASPMPSPSRKALKSFPPPSPTTVP
ncbi:hypothetical protein FQR65_LT11999 [Abscondita terminalis]|nr:hypothetical protein FQR65_LT11999 [Abscondita terminalis]